MLNIRENCAINPNPDFWDGRRVLLTGHNGFKGSWLTLWLARLGAKVTGFSLPPSTYPNLFNLAIKDKVTSCIADVRDFEALRTCLEEVRPEVVLHLAAQALVHPSYVDPVGTFATNIMGTVHLLQSVKTSPSVRSVVVVTSDKAYKNREWAWPYRETEALGGHDPYSCSKGCAELVTAAYRDSFFSEDQNQTCIASARAGNVIGGGDWSQYRLIPDLIRAFQRGESVEIRSPRAIRPWQHVLEPVCGYLRLAECLASSEGRKFAEAWNFGPADEDCRPVHEIVDQLANRWGGGACWHQSDKDYAHEATYLKVDSSKARASLGWDRRLRLDEALAWTADWYREQGKGASPADLTLAQIEAYEALGV